MQRCRETAVGKEEHSKFMRENMYRSKIQAKRGYFQTQQSSDSEYRQKEA